MRLIDADKYLEKVCTYKETGCGSCKLQTMCPKDIPTVKAIPVEQIKSKIDAILDSYPDGNEETEILCKLLYEWEKENERI